MRCLLDMDGVLVDFVSGACNAHGLVYPYDNPRFHGEWDFHKLSGLSGNQFYKPFDAQFWSDLDWMPDGREILAWLEAKFGQPNICLLTSPPRTNIGECVKGKMDWVSKHCPQFERQILIGPSKEFCAHRGSILVDDKDSNCDAYRAAGGHVHLVPRPWNSSHRLSHAVMEDLVTKLRRI